jgi:tetratricopeptide (TPR) repeat protein
MENVLTKKRNVFPRWRAPAFTLKPELESVDSYPKSFDQNELQANLVSLYEKWREKPTLANASEVIDSAVLIKNPYLAIGPAKAILVDKDAMPAIKRVAEFIIDGPSNVDLETESAFESRDKSIESIRSIKHRLVEEPRNSLLLLEKARLQTQIGDKNGAHHSLHTALAVAPESREVLRAYARFTVHTERAEEGHARLARSERLVRDPWIQAAEIALAQTSERTPKSIKFARELLRNRKAAPVHLSELAAALATFEVGEGATPLAKKYFRQSLENPTENALSQAYWVQQELRVPFPIANSKLMVPRAFEARVRAATWNRRWRDALENCRKWITDEPFSLRAAVEGSFIASSYAWSNQDAIAFCDFGLIANPNEETLLNNKAVALIRCGRVSEARAIIESLQKRIPESDIEPFLPATTGLLHFAEGDLGRGRAMYLEALDVARKHKSHDSQFRAFIHWVFEEVSVGGLTNASEEAVLKRIDDMAPKLHLHPNTMSVWAILKEKMLQVRPPEPAVSQVDLPLLMSNLSLVADTVASSPSEDF